MQESERAQRIAAWRALMEDLAGGADISGMELVGLIRIIYNHLDALVSEKLRAADLSGPRMGILIRLMAEERNNGDAGVSPTHLSRCQNVSKNTISTLLRGLEDQGLIERTLDPTDKRVFRIRLTQAGRERVRALAPLHLAHMNTILADLTPAEKAQLTALLAKLHRSIRAHSDLQPSPVASEHAPIHITSGGN